MTQAQGQQHISSNHPLTACWFNIAANTPAEDIMKWGKETFDYWMELFTSSEAAAAGMQLVDVFQLWDVSHSKSFCKASNAPGHHIP